jgi:general secretion pathway protein D
MILRGGPFSSLRDEVRVVVDDINNVLHIQATLADYRVLLSAIERMDMPPRQVLIDVQIFQADLTDELNYGFRGVLEELRTGNMTTAGMAGMTENNAGLLSFDTFASVGNSRQISLGLAALKTRTNVRSLENPQLMAMDGTPASFVSGAEVPYPTDSFASTIGVTSGMAYRETGVNLQIVPRISASGTVRLEIVQEVSTVSTVAGLNNAPVFPLTQVQTTLSVRDGETVAIAGLISDNSRWGRSGIPFLSEIPFIGGLFGATSRNNQRTELIILLTPHVIGTQDRFQEVTHGLRDSLRNVRRLIDEHERNSIRDIEDARRERERRELNEIRNIRPPR